jgi:predicted MFS family arabinose efflux permease
VRTAIDMLRGEPRARWFFGALAQSALGNGAGYVALLLIAYDRWHSPWAITLVLMADLLPAMVLGPVFGAAADRWSRKACMIIADLLRFGAFVGIAFVDGIELTLLLALVAGCGTGLYTPAALASLPGLVQPERLPAATSVYGAIADLGFTVGPALAAVVLLFGDAEQLTLVNGITFGVSAIVLARLAFGKAPPAAEGAPRSLLAEARDGLVATAGMPGIRALLGVSAGALFFAGLFNVAELPFAEDILDSGEVGYSVLATAFGAGFIAGSLTGSGGASPAVLKQRFGLGLLVLGVGFVATGFAPGFVVALAAFAIGGFGNGMVIVYERQLIQATVPDRLSGRIFGMKDALSAWGFGLAFVAAGGLITLIGVRELLVAAGIGALLSWLVARRMLADAFNEGEPVLAGGRVSGASTDAVGHGGAGEQRTDLVSGTGSGRRAGLDDRAEGFDDGGIELRPRTPP